MSEHEMTTFESRMDPRVSVTVDAIQDAVHAEETWLEMAKRIVAAIDSLPVPHLDITQELREAILSQPIPLVGETVTIVGTVRTVESLWPGGHYRVTVDVPLAQGRAR